MIPKLNFLTLKTAGRAQRRWRQHGRAHNGELCPFVLVARQRVDINFVVCCGRCSAGRVPLSCPRVSSAGASFTKHPANQTVSQGNSIRLGCAVQGVTEPDIVWMKDGEKLYSTDQMFITLGEQHWETFHRFIPSIRSVTAAAPRAGRKPRLSE